MKITVGTASLVLLILLPADTHVQAYKTTDDLSDTRVYGPCGYIDKAGEFVVPPQFAEANAFSEGLAYVGIAGSALGPEGSGGYIDRAGRMLVTPKPWPTYGAPFSEGLAPIRVGGNVHGRDGYIDKTGKIVIAPKFRAVYGFHGGLSVVGVYTSLAYIDKTGKYAFQRRFVDAEDFSEGLAAAAVAVKPAKFPLPRDLRWGYINKRGKFVIRPRFRYTRASEGHPAQPFSEGLAAVEIGGKMGYIDREGRVVINPRFDWAQPFADSRALVVVGAKYGYINKKGVHIARPRFEFGEDFSEGLACVWVRVGKDTQCGFIDKEGHLAIRPQFDGARSFHEGLAAVEIKGKWGFVDRKGAVVIPPRFSETTSFHEGLAAVSLPSGDVLPTPVKGRRDGSDTGLHDLLCSRLRWYHN